MRVLARTTKTFHFRSNEVRDANRSGPDIDDARQQTAQQRSGTDRNPVGADSQNEKDSRQDADREQRLRRGVKFGQANDRGLTINTVERNSWHYNSGFRQGDVIVSVYGRPVRSDADFYRFVVLRPGQRVPVIVLRDGQRETIYVEQDVVHAHHYDARHDSADGAYLGVTFRAEVHDAAIVKSVNPGSPAKEAGLQAGDIIVALNDNEVRSYQDVIQLVGAMRPGDELEIVVERSRNEEQLTATLDAKRDLRTATRRTDVNVERTNVDQYDGQVEVYREGDNRGRVRDRSNDGRGERALLPGRRN